MRHTTSFIDGFACLTCAAVYLLTLATFDAPNADANLHQQETESAEPLPELALAVDVFEEDIGFQGVRYSEARELLAAVPAPADSNVVLRVGGGNGTVTDRRVSEVAKLLAQSLPGCVRRR